MLFHNPLHRLQLAVIFYPFGVVEHLFRGQAGIEVVETLSCFVMEFF